jgi:hypothetical protein
MVLENIDNLNSLKSLAIYLYLYLSAVLLSETRCTTCGPVLREIFDGAVIY